MGRWCETEICGNRLRTQAYRRRINRRGAASVPRRRDSNRCPAGGSKLGLRDPRGAD
jgi:hypothetical protein